MVPQVVSVKVETGWRDGRPLLDCTARISRPLNAREREGMARFPEFSVAGKTVAWSCRPEETEASEKRLAAVLSQAGRPRTMGRGRWLAEVETVAPSEPTQ